MNYDHLTNEELLRVIDRSESSNVRTLCERLEKQMEKFKQLTYEERDCHGKINTDQLSLFGD